MKTNHHSQKYFYSQEEIDYLKSIFNGTPSKQIIELYNQKYNKNMTYNQLIAFKKQYNVKSGLDVRFKAGKVINPNPPLPIGHEIISYKNGLKRVRIKVAEHKYVEKSRYIYEQHYGKIPEDCNIIFLDGNRDNYNIDNLKCITKSQHRILAGNCLYFQDKELNKTSILIAQLQDKTIDYGKVI